SRLPASARWSPSRSPSSVVLPAPLAPRSPVTPGWISTSTPPRAVVAPHRFTTPRARTTGCTGGDATGRDQPGQGTSLRRMAEPHDVPVHDPRKPRSHEVTDGFRRAPARAMLRAVGLGDDDWDKPQVA